MNRSYLCGLLTAVVAATGLLCQGCGVGEYEKRMEEYLATQGTGETADLRKPFTLEEIEGKEVRVRMPTAFEEAYTPTSDVDEARKKIPFVELPGHQRTYEGFVEASDKSKTPYYCYLGARSLSGAVGGKKRLLGRFANALTDFSKDAEIDAKDYFVTAEGSQSEWLKWRASGPMAFVKITKDGQEQAARADGVLEAYGKVQDGILVMVAWRYPQSLADRTAPGFPGIEAMKKAVAAHIKIQ